MTSNSILWRRIDHPGHESAYLTFEDYYWRLAGTAVFSHQGAPCRLDYLVRCNQKWETVGAYIRGWIAETSIDIQLSVHAGRRWHLNGKECADVEGCIDLDLNFSPSTNLLPIRRLALETGQAADVRAAWLRFPSFRLELLEQRYMHLSDGKYRYESAGGRFTTELSVDQAGFVTNYPGFWSVETE